MFFQVRGSYSFTDPEGEVFSLQYLADKGGFQPTADHLPVVRQIYVCICRYMYVYASIILFSMCMYRMRCVLCSYVYDIMRYNSNVYLSGFSFINWMQLIFLYNNMNGTNSRKRKKIKIWFDFKNNGWKSIAIFVADFIPVIKYDIQIFSHVSLLHQEKIVSVK